MARKTKYVVITDGTPETNRDFGKRFLLTEMAAGPAEKWAARAFLALARSGVDIPEDIATAGWAGIAVTSLRMIAGIHFAEAEPLMDEMFACVQFCPDPDRPEFARAGPVMENEVEEVPTRLKLRWEVVHLHVANFMDAFLSTWESLRRLGASQDTGTSPGPSRP
jgi:hypothetical protein